MKRALITGVCGQDGSYLAELLLSKGYNVDGLDRPGGDTTIRQRNITHLIGGVNFKLVPGDMLSLTTLYDIGMRGYDEIYHLAAQSHVGQSFEDPILTVSVNATATMKLLEVLARLSKHTKLYFAASSEMFGDIVYGESANEQHPLMGKSPYAVSKIAAFNMCHI